MRIATFILSFVPFLLLGCQSVTVLFGGAVYNSLADNQTRSMASAEAGWGGLLVTLVALFGTAFQLTWPKVAAVFFALAGYLALQLPPGYNDTRIYAFALFVLAVMAFFSRRSPKVHDVRVVDQPVKVEHV